MKRILLIAIALLLSTLYIISGDVALVSSDKGVAAEPLSAKPGDVIMVRGVHPGARGVVQVRLIGTTTDIDLGEVDTNDSGDFAAQLQLPTDLLPGKYLVKARGIELATIEIAVPATSQAEIHSAPTLTRAQATAHKQRLSEIIGLIAVFDLLAGLGLFCVRLAWRGLSLGEPRGSHAGVFSHR